uniref:Uncharacterized protein n=1 Tax=Hucho hucho TaxID=62062 RepID=A0A4W5NME8_9TELE
MQCLTLATVTGHYNLQMCLSMVLSMVMAGSGNLKVLELCRFLHKRTSGEMNYDPPHGPGHARPGRKEVHSQHLQLGHRCLALCALPPFSCPQHR